MRGVKVEGEERGLACKTHVGVQSQDQIFNCLGEAMVNNNRRYIENSG